MRFTEIFLCLAVVCCVSLGQVLLRQAALSFEGEVSLRGMNVNFLFRAMFALLVYGVAMLLWVYVLAKIPLSIAFSFFGLSFVLVPVFAHYALGEVLTWRTWLGAIVICTGIGITVG